MQPIKSFQSSLLLPVFLLAGSAAPLFSQAQLATDQTNYNVGATVQVRLSQGEHSTAAVRYAGEQRPLRSGIALEGTAYQQLWHIPGDARTGRYLVDVTGANGTVRPGVASFAVHRQLAKVTAFDLDKTFYTAGDSVNPRIVVQNISDGKLEHLQVEFESYTYPWIAPAADEPPAWKTLATSSLTLAPGETKEFQMTDAAKVQAAEGKQTYIYYSAVIRDSEHPDHIYDLAFAPPAITAPLSGKEAEKTYPMLYLYPNAADVSKSESYREFYPAGLLSDTIHFHREHTMFPAGVPLAVRFSVSGPALAQANSSSVHFRFLDATGKARAQGDAIATGAGEFQAKSAALEPGLYTVEVTQKLSDGGSNTAGLDIGVNELPKSLLIFCAHEDDDTADPEIIRAAVENDIPVHIVYFTGGDAGGCDRYYMHSCDASRAMDFGEVRMSEARASLAHLGVPKENVFFLGLPDGGMEQIWQHNESDKPYLSVLLASDHSPYPDLAVPNLAYAHDAVLAATKTFLTRYKASWIMTGHPDERHVDHRTNNWFVVEAMQDLQKQGALANKTRLIVDQVYGPGPQKSAPYKYAKTQFYVSGEAGKLGQEASWYYQTQDGNHQQAEIVTYDKLPRDAPAPHWGYYHWPYPHYEILDWQEHAGWNK